MFAAEAAQLKRIFAGENVSIEHVGSTAVPGLGAKPIIDLMLGVEDLAQATDRIEALENFDYHYDPILEKDIPDRRYFRKPLLQPRTHHLHVVKTGGEFWVSQLKFRDYLRAHPGVAQQYYELKARVAEECNQSGADYTSAKAPFIRAVLEAADDT